MGSFVFRRLIGKFAKNMLKIYWLYTPDDVEEPLWNDGHLYCAFRNSNRQSLDEKFILEFLKGRGSFVTLNPVVANYLSDELAKEIVYVKTPASFKKLGDVSEIQWKFESLGAGEILCDTDFLKLH